MLTMDYEQAYISSFVKIFTILKEDYEIYVNNCEYNNYEIEIKKINNDNINEYLSICFQKQNGSLTVIASLNIDEKYIKKLLKDISLALNENILATYNFKDYKNYIVYHYSYVNKNIIIDNKKILKELRLNNEIENLNFNVN